MKRIVALFLGLLVPIAGFAAGPAAVRKTMEASMLVTGWAMIEPDGSVSRLDLDEREKLPSAVTDLLDKAEAQWKFEPILVDGVARKGKARMSLRIVAKKVNTDEYEISIRGGYFGEEAMTPEERLSRADSIKRVSMAAPSYPIGALKARARGTVYLLLRIGRDGKVQGAFAEQVNLRVITHEHAMNQLRDMFAKSAVSAARSWRFQLPIVGEHADDETWLVRVPIDYDFHGEVKPRYGQWHVYVPGPRQAAPWEMEQLDSSQSPDAMIAGVLYEAGKGLRLLTPLQPG